MFLLCRLSGRGWIGLMARWEGISPAHRMPTNTVPVWHDGRGSLLPSLCQQTQYLCDKMRSLRQSTHHPMFVFGNAHIPFWANKCWANITSQVLLTCPVGIYILQLVLFAPYNMSDVVMQHITCVGGYKDCKNPTTLTTARMVMLLLLKNSELIFVGKYAHQVLIRFYHSTWRDVYMLQSQIWQEKNVRRRSTVIQ